eukprot:2747412-Pyramimonas_sp.AAC.3
MQLNPMSELKGQALKDKVRCFLGFASSGQVRQDRIAKMKEKQEQQEEVRPLIDRKAKEAAAQAAQKRPALKKMKTSELEDAIGHDLEMEMMEPQGSHASRPPPERPQERDDDAGAGLPHGWLACPSYGRAYDKFIPCK